jgi:SAM-dependent MidA family methyltransferase
MVSFEEFQRKRNREYYTTRGLDFLKDFKTFAADKYFAQAIAKDLYSKITKRGTINIYEMGIGTGTLFISIMLSLRKIDPSFTERIVYHLCDISETLVKNAVKRGDAFGFNVDGIVYEGLPNFVKSADYILSNELYSDLPARILVRKGENVYELHIENEKNVLKELKENGEIKKYMSEMPEGYFIPINEFAKRHLQCCAKGLALRGFIDIFDYGFDSPHKITELYPEQWNNAIYRDYGGQITTDLNFHYLAIDLNATIEPQKNFVERVLNEKFEEDLDSMRYRVCKKKTDIIEESDFYHMRVKK